MELQQLSLARLTGLCGNEVILVFSNDAIMVLIRTVTSSWILFQVFFFFFLFSVVTPIRYEISNNANSGNKMQSVC